MKRMVCLVSYWLVLLAPIALILVSLPQKKRLLLAIPIGALLVLFGDRGLKQWKRYWRV